jgi:hypothetical protein
MLCDVVVKRHRLCTKANNNNQSCERIKTLEGKKILRKWENCSVRGCQD